MADTTSPEYCHIKCINTQSTQILCWKHMQTTSQSASSSVFCSQQMQITFNLLNWSKKRTARSFTDSRVALKGQPSYSSQTGWEDFVLLFASWEMCKNSERQFITESCILLQLAYFPHCPQSWIGKLHGVAHSISQLQLFMLSSWRSKGEKNVNGDRNRITEGKKSCHSPSNHPSVLESHWTQF